MPRNEKAVHGAKLKTLKANPPAATVQRAAAVKPKAKKSAKPAAKTSAARAPQSKSKPQSALQKPAKPAKPAKTAKPKKPASPSRATAELLDSTIVFDGPLFRVRRDRIIEPSGKETTRDIIRHNGSAVILAIDNSKSKKDPWVVMERQYRHATGQFLWELPAGKLEVGESALEGAQRELEEETGYRAKKWKPLVEYFASPGFLGEAMKVFLAEGLTVGQTNWDADEQIELRLVKLSELLKKIDKGEIQDGKTLIGVLAYARQQSRKRGK